MPTVVRIPNIRALVDPLLGRPYREYDCWRLVRTLLKAGFQLDIDADPERAAQHIVEVWYRGDIRAPLALLQPWDFVILATKGLVSNHLGLVVDTTHFVHTRQRCGVVLEPLHRWHPKFLQIARLRTLV